MRNEPPRIIYFWPDSGDEDANCGLWWPEPTLEDAPEAGPGTPALVVPDNLSKGGARAALFHDKPDSDLLDKYICQDIVVEACKHWPAAVAVLLAGAIRRMGEEKHG